MTEEQKTSGTLAEIATAALRRAYSLGQQYWQQADSDYFSDHRKSEETRATFEALVSATAATLSPAAPQPAPATGDEQPSLRAAANLAYNALHECKPLKGAEKQVSDAVRALHEALKKESPRDGSLPTTAMREVRGMDMARQLPVASVQSAHPSQPLDMVSSGGERKVLPCPFCGSDDVDPGVDRAGNACLPSPECRSCNATAVSATAWNRRVWQASAAHRREDQMSQAARDLLAERVRQITHEGWTPEHDDEHDDGSMAQAAGCYALAAAGYYTDASGEIESPESDWPWDEQWWKPTTPRRMLVKAGGLILAEIERIDRTAAPAHGEPGALEQGDAL